MNLWRRNTSESSSSGGQDVRTSKPPPSYGDSVSNPQEMMRAASQPSDGDKSELARLPSYNSQVLDVLRKGEASTEIKNEHLQLFPVAYEFNQDPGPRSAMILAPTKASASARSYHIEVKVNPWDPTSTITTVRRGTSSDGEYVGKFEKRDSHATVVIGSTHDYISRVLKETHHSIWTWDTISLRWDVDTCYVIVNRNKEMIARFRPEAIVTPIRSHQPYAAQLMVYPEGNKYLDHIVMSLLILEGRRYWAHGRIERPA